MQDEQHSFFDITRNRWFVAIWAILLVGGVSIILLSRPAVNTTANSQQRTTQTARVSIMPTLMHAKDEAGKILRCLGKKECRAQYYAQGGLGNAVQILDYSLAQTHTSGECARGLLLLSHGLEPIVKKEDRSSKGMLQRFRHAIDKTLKLCDGRFIPLQVS